MKTLPLIFFKYPGICKLNCIAPVQVHALFFFLQVDPFYDTLKLLVVDSITAVIYPSLGGQQMDGKTANHSNLSETILQII